MTIIAGLVHDREVYMAADSGSIDQNTYGIITRKDPKIAIHEGILIGAAGSPRIRQLLHTGFSIPTLNNDVPVFDYLVLDFVDALRDLFKNEPQKDGVQTLLDESSIMVGIRGQLFCIGGDYQVEEVANEYAAIGIASDIALGSLHSTRSMRGAPNLRLMHALEACKEHNATIREPFIYLSI
jgi:hypothetical protein